MSIPKALLVYGGSFALYCGLAACGDKDSDNDDRGIQRPIYTNEEPVAYDLYDPGCQESTTTVDIDQAPIWGWQGFEVVAEPTPLEGTRSRISLESPFISSTTFGKTYTRTCEYSEGQATCAKADGGTVGYLPPSDEQYLRVCNSNFSYPRDTYEGAALTSVAYLNAAAASYEHAMKRPLTRVKVEIFPSFETIISNVPLNGDRVDMKLFTTDNLAFFPGHDMIVVFPQSKSFYRSNRDRFWESSFVPAHEYGHKVEEDHTGEDMRELGYVWNPNGHTYLRTLTGSADGLAHPHMWTAVSEAFADLNAFYAIGESIATLENVDCIGRNRNVTTGTFGDGTPKHLDAGALETLDNANYSAMDCEAVDYADPHLVGAVLAHGLYRIFAAAGRDSVHRYTLTVEWLEKMVAAALQERDLVTLQLMSTALEEQFSESQADIKQKICMISREHFHYLDRIPFEQHCATTRNFAP